MRYHSQICQTGGADVLQAEPWTDANPAPWTDNDALREVYQINRPLILQNHRDQGKRKKNLIFPLSYPIFHFLFNMINIYLSGSLIFFFFFFRKFEQNIQLSCYKFFVPTRNCILC